MSKEKCNLFVESSLNLEVPWTEKVLRGAPVPILTKIIRVNYTCLATSEPWKKIMVEIEKFSDSCYHSKFCHFFFMLVKPSFWVIFRVYSFLYAQGLPWFLLRGLWRVLGIEYGWQREKNPDNNRQELGGTSSELKMGVQGWGHLACRRSTRVLSQYAIWSPASQE